MSTKQPEALQSPQDDPPISALPVLPLPGDTVDSVTDPADSGNNILTGKEAALASGRSEGIQKKEWQIYLSPKRNVRSC